MELTYVQSFLLDLISNYINFLILELFTTTFFSYKLQQKYSSLRAFYLFIYFVIALIPSIPYSALIFWIIELMYMLLISSFHLKQSILFSFKYEIYYNVLYIICSSITTIINVSILDNSSRNDIYF